MSGAFSCRCTAHGQRRQHAALTWLMFSVERDREVSERSRLMVSEAASEAASEPSSTGVELRLLSEEPGRPRPCR